MPGAPTLADLLDAVVPLDAHAMRRARQRQRQLTKPPGSLGRLEGLAIQLAGIQGCARPTIHNPALIIAAGDHGVVAQGVTAYPQDVTAQMVANFLAGGAAVNAICSTAGVGLVIIDAGIATELPPHPNLRVLAIGRGTANITDGPAMSRRQAERCLLEGARVAREVIATGVDLIAIGEMGIGNTTAASAVVAALTGATAEQTTGCGSGRTPEQLAHKIAVVQQALTMNHVDPADPVGVLAAVGGYEIGVLAGAILGSAAAQRPIVLDGFITGAAALVAVALSQPTRAYLIAGHRSTERGHRLVLQQLKLRPLLALDLRLGEGSGAALAIATVRAAAACHTQMATFAEAGVLSPSAETSR